MLICNQVGSVQCRSKYLQFIIKAIRHLLVIILTRHRRWSFKVTHYLRDHKQISCLKPQIKPESQQLIGQS